ncbi:hypothetical protein, unlikely [Trypanosoma brucei gambiense DAL972]|uniref:Uncharacterized protein n=1 Tax=Trypanosoma brucei gambiense (strain MHOM/CI/86/DAL972) TaxID=679716 RepID=D0A6I8_TRYB9|nr:hypothetical protein, unlikely [Trypanosoma brucei gambiense DAL972]CBH17289.1 hypothetical protein, unlikely [Trypanosoma brucei gambiense DAL972]|eukprot:XP_011779553.1 hypothetical protein, unlikely [Trypanosoma brucei gambiense DAL972]
MDTYLKRKNVDNLKVMKRWCETSVQVYVYTPNTTIPLSPHLLTNPLSRQKHCGTCPLRNHRDEEEWTIPRRYSPFIKIQLVFTFLPMIEPPFTTFTSIPKVFYSFSHLILANSCIH